MQPHGPFQGHGGGGFPYAPLRPPPRPRHATPETARRAAGLTLYVLFTLVGIALNLLGFVAEVLGNPDPGRAASAMLIGGVLAFPPLVIYLFVPAVIDRFDPEPWWCLAMAFVWGAVVATGFGGQINSTVAFFAERAYGADVGRVITVAVSAPIAEEVMKGLCVFGFFYFLRREFDGVVDGIVYATFCALGFAAVENVQYYGRAALSDEPRALGVVFFLRGVLAPWGHPLYTSMTGIGFGIARESSRLWVRVLAPLAGLSCGILLHAIWNFVPTVLPRVFFPSLILWFVFVLAFFVMVCVLVLRKGRVIREHLRDEVAMGNLSVEEVDLICSPVGRLRATLSWRGKPGRDFINAGARLALSKWHTARAMRGKTRTLSGDFIVPLRQELSRLRALMAARAPRMYPPRWG